MKYKAVIFDLDGTLLDTLDDLRAALNHALAENHLPERTLDEVRRFVGNGVRLLVQRAVPDGEQNPLFDSVFESFKSRYGAHCRDMTRPYDGVEELLRTLRDLGVKTAVVSNKLDSAVKELCREYFGELIAAAIGETENIRRKPAPDSVMAALEQIGCSPRDSVYVGDSETDIQTAFNCGMDCISVTWGFRDRDTLINAGAKVFADDPEAVLALIR